MLRENKGWKWTGMRDEGRGEMRDCVINLQHIVNLTQNKYYLCVQIYHKASKMYSVKITDKK